MLPAYVVFSRLLVQLAFHKHVKEKADSCIISELLVDVDCPKERMRFGVFSIREADEVDSYMANYIFIIKGRAH